MPTHLLQSRLCVRISRPFLFASSHHRRACASVLTSKLTAKTLHISRVTLSKQRPLTPGSCYTPCSPPARPGSTSPGLGRATHTRIYIYIHPMAKFVDTHIYAINLGMHTHIMQSRAMRTGADTVSSGRGIASTTAVTSMLFWEREGEREKGKVVWREWGLSDTRRGQRLEPWQPQWRPADRHWADMSCWGTSDPGNFLCTLMKSTHTDTHTHTHTHTHTVLITACLYAHTAATRWCAQGLSGTHTLAHTHAQ